LGSIADELQHILHAVDIGHNKAAYMFGILTIKYNNSLVEVEEALVHLDKFMMPLLADPTIQKWIHSVC
jgi:hypothetical protein